MSDIITLRAIGHVRGGRSEPIDDDWDAVESVIALDPAQFAADATASLGDFSHIEVVFHFNQVPDAEINRGARHPRGRKDWPLVGIFAQRGKGRPNRIGVTVCRLLSVDGLTLHVQRPRRDRRHAGDRHQAGHERVSATRRSARTGLGEGADGGILVTPFWYSFPLAPHSTCFRDLVEF